MVTNIAIIGHGIVGKATEEVLLKKNNIQIHDPEKGHKCDYKNADVVFICTPYEHVGRYMIELKHNQNVLRRRSFWADSY